MTLASSPEPALPDGVPTPTRYALFRNFALVGLTGFGGVLPWARRMLVERQGWLTDCEFAELLPLATWLAWRAPVGRS